MALADILIYSQTTIQTERGPRLRMGLCGLLARLCESSIAANKYARTFPAVERLGDPLLARAHRHHGDRLFQGTATRRTQKSVASIADFAAFVDIRVLCSRRREPPAPCATPTSSSRIGRALSLIPWTRNTGFASAEALSCGIIE